VKNPTANALDKLTNSFLILHNLQRRINTKSAISNSLSVNRKRERVGGAKNNKNKLQVTFQNRGGFRTIDQTHKAFSQ